MPYARSYRKQARTYRRSKAPKYNKWQRKAWKRRTNAYKNRQQLLSIKTVKAIAKNVVKQAPEIKFYGSDEYINAKQVIQDPTDLHSEYVYTQLISPTFITQGSSVNQREGNRIHIKGINFRIHFHLPYRQNLSKLDAGYRTGSYHRCHVKLVRVKTAGDANISVPDSIHTIPNTLWVYKGALNRVSATKKPNYETLFSKEYTFKPKLQTDMAHTITTDNLTATSTGNSVHLGYNVPQTVMLDKYVKIDKKHTFLGATDHSVRYRYFLWIYAYGLNQGLQGASAYWGGEEDFALKADYNWIVYYTDA